MSNVTGPRHPHDSVSKRGQPLSPRECKVMDLLTSGMTDQEIAKAMGITSKGVESHLENIRYKLGLGRRVLLALYWHERKKHENFIS